MNNELISTPKVWGTD